MDLMPHYILMYTFNISCTSQSSLLVRNINFLNAVTLLTCTYDRMYIRTWACVCTVYELAAHFSLKRHRSRGYVQGLSIATSLTPCKIRGIPHPAGRVGPACHMDTRHAMPTLIHYHVSMIHNVHVWCGKYLYTSYCMHSKEVARVTSGGLSQR